MTQPASTPQNVQKKSADNIDELLSDLDMSNAGSDTVEELIEEIEEVVSEPDEGAIDDALDDAALKAVEADIERQDAYADQSSALSADASAPATAQANKKNKKPRAAGTPRAPKDLNSLDAVNFVLEGDPAKMDKKALEAVKTATIALVPKQVKIAEKFENLFGALATGKLPSRYTVDAFKLLDDKKSITSSDLVTALIAGGVKEGTARSQSGQMMHLFDVTKIANRAKNTLVINDKSVIAERLRNAIKINTPSS